MTLREALLSGKDFRRAGSSYSSKDFTGGWSNEAILADDWEIDTDVTITRLQFREAFEKARSIHITYGGLFEQRLMKELGLLYE